MTVDTKIWACSPAMAMGFKPIAMQKPVVNAKMNFKNHIIAKQPARIYA